MTVDSVTELEVGIMLVMMEKVVEMILQKLRVLCETDCEEDESLMIWRRLLSTSCAGSHHL